MRPIWAFSALTVLLAGCDSTPPAMLLDHPTAVEGTDIDVKFSPAIDGRAYEQFWIQLAPLGALDSLTEGRVFLERGTSVHRLPVDAPGHYEVRLHASSADHPPSVILRQPLTVFPSEHVLASLTHPGLPAGREVHAIVATD